jgi:hypothetical protein
MTELPLDHGVVLDPETIELLRRCLDEAWAQLSGREQAKTLKSDLAITILRAASDGERDPEKLRACALSRVFAPS